MSDRAAKQARRAKRKAKRAERESTRERQYRCVDCGTGPLYRGGIEVGGPTGERHYCKACMPVERAEAILKSWGSPVYRVVVPDDVDQVDTRGRT
jgi:hypothetical protein